MKVRLSWGTAEALGLIRVQGGPTPATAYLLTVGGCVMACSFCPQARTSVGGKEFLSRVIWPEFELAEVMERLSLPERLGFGRICIQAVENSETQRHIREILSGLRLIPDCPPVSVSFHPKNAEEVREIFAFGAERVGIALDLANREAFGRFKGGFSFDSTFDLIKESAGLFPGKVSTHLMVGLGETEEEVIRLIQAMRDLGVSVGLFAFTPVKGTPLSGWPQPELGSYRRIQLALFLIREGRVRAEELSFEGGRLTGFGIEPEEIMREPAIGNAFRTSGCPGCDRPFYNETPRGPFYNYWRPLSREEAREAVRLVFEGTGVGEQ